MRVEQMETPSSVQWLCVTHTALPVWRDTRVRFELTEQGQHSSILTLRHVGLTPQLECYDECARGWDHFLASMVKLVERNEGTPWRRADSLPPRAVRS
jgi:hypothetical protein